MDRIHQLKCSNWIQSVSLFSRDEKVNPEAILSTAQRVESDLFCTQVFMDMRRLEYDCKISSTIRKKKREQELCLVHDKHIPFSSKFHSYPKRKKSVHPFPLHFAITGDSSKQLTNRQELLAWAYNHGDIWAKTFLNGKLTQTVPGNLHIRNSFLKEEENNLCTISLYFLHKQILLLFN